jgi:site-specific recombinase XerD
MNQEIENLFALFEKIKQAQGDKLYTAPADEEHIRSAQQLQCLVTTGMKVSELLTAILERVEVERERKSSGLRRYYSS